MKGLDGLIVPRLVRDEDACLTCRRRGVGCAKYDDCCSRCEHDGLECVPTIGHQVPAWAPHPILCGMMDQEVERTLAEARAAARAAAARGEVAGAEYSPVVIHLEAGLEAEAPVPVGNDYLFNVMQEYSLLESGSQHASEVLPHVPGHVVVDPEFETPCGIDRDLEYAIYYDYDHDAAPGLQVITTNRGESCLAYVSDMASPTPAVYEIPAPRPGQRVELNVSLGEFFNYMRECHLSTLPGAALPMSLLPAREYSIVKIFQRYRATRENIGLVKPNTPLADQATEEFAGKVRLLALIHASPLAAQLVLAQQVGHRRVASTVFPTGESVEGFYAESIDAFKPCMDAYANGDQEEMVPLTVASIVLALTEKARLDKRGQSQNLAPAAKDILKNLATRELGWICRGLPPFLVDYYFHTASFACLVVDVTKVESPPFVGEEMATRADQMVADGYSSNLCGSWFELVAFIPKIFAVALELRGPHRRAYQGDAVGPNFRALEAEIMAWKPAQGSQHPGAAAFFHFATVLYHWSASDWPFENRHGYRVRNTEDGQVLIDLAMERLAEVDARSPVNIALCWPMVVIGCFTTSPEHQAILRRRLEYIADCHAVGNAADFLTMLKGLWMLPTYVPINPWSIHRYVQDLYLL